MLILLTIFWFVQFTNKLGSAPIQFSERATENRNKWNIPTDSLDYAVTPAYLDSVRAKGAQVCHVSRWMNGCTIEADSASAMAIEQLPFVQAIEQTRNETPPSKISARKFSRATSSDIDPYQDNRQQLETYNLLPLHQLGYEGQGRLIAVIDIGFYRVDQASCFSQIQDSIIGYYDFSSDTTAICGSTQGQHGANCLSFIAAQTPTYHGAATRARYVLIRTEEYASESPKECDNLIAAYELCDSLGVNIISTSLGYRLFDNPTFNLSYDMLDGRTTRVSRAATIAARKGMLICQSAGNDGNDVWHKISVPSDADSILTIGACQTDSIMGAFSSYGPSADGRIKPEVTAVGVKATYWSTVNDSVASGNGTSFSTPLTAGLAACLWSALPNESAQQIRQRIIESAHLYPSYDLNHQMGYGIPDAIKAYQASPTSLPEVFNHQLTDSPTPRFTKLIKANQLLILRDGKLYNALGDVVKN